MQRNHLHLLNFYSSTYYFYFITPFHLRSIVCPLQGIFCVSSVSFAIVSLWDSAFYCIRCDVISAKTLSEFTYTSSEWHSSEKKEKKMAKIQIVAFGTFSKDIMNYDEHFFSCMLSLLSPTNKNCMHSFCCMLFISVALYLFCGIFVYFFVFECIIMFDFSHPDLWWFFEDFRYNCLFSQCWIVSANLKTCICDSFNSININIIVRWLFQIPFVPLTISAHTHKHTQRTH